jgi:hypothetical protein
MSEPLGDELGALLIVRPSRMLMSVGSARKKTPAVRVFTFWASARVVKYPRRGRRLQPHFSRPFQLRRVRMQRPFALQYQKMPEPSSFSFTASLQ